MSNCCYPGSNEADKIAIAALHREIKQLRHDVEADLLLKEGKINATCVCIKNILSDYLRTMLDNMWDTGELDHIITEAILSEVEELRNVVYPIGHVKRYGAVGDGIQDDTFAFIQAAKNAREHKSLLMCDYGTYRITQDVNARYVKGINIAGNIVCENNATLIVGDSSANGEGVTIHLAKVDNVKVVGLKNSIINFKSIGSLVLYANADNDGEGSIAYNTFNGAYCRDVSLTGEGEGDGLSWINENVFNIKRVSSITFDGDYGHNNNHFEHCNLEKGTINIHNARNNYISARCEGSVTVNDTGEAQANFIEREYYYRHYFGDGVKETEHGTLLYYPVTKLQTERELYRLSKENKNFPIGSLVFTQNGMFRGNNFNPIYHSNLIKIDNTFSLKMKASSKAFRVQLRFYDENKNRIITEVDNFADGRMDYINSDWLYGIQSNVDTDIVTFFPGKAKYVEYKVLFGSNVTTIDVEYLAITLIKYTTTDIHIADTLKHNTYTSVPTTGYWEQGQMLYAKYPKAGAYIGVICVTSGEGTNAVWKNFANVAV